MAQESVGRMTILHAENLSYAYPGKILFRDFSLTVDQGEWIAIIGNNGTGKTTLLKILAGLLMPQSGSVTLGDVQGPLAPQERLYVGQHDFSEHVAFPATALEVVMSAYTAKLGLIKRPTTRQVEKAKAMLDIMGLAQTEHLRLSDLSGGQRQRVFIAKALLSEPKLLFLDEPTSALDARFTLDLFHRLKEAQANGLTIVMITHDLALAQTVADRVFCLGEADILQLDDAAIAEELAHRHTHLGGSHEHVSV
jgi:zinc transport system ATP-binding protein